MSHCASLEYATLRECFEISMVGKVLQFKTQDDIDAIEAKYLNLKVHCGQL